MEWGMKKLEEDVGFKEAWVKGGKQQSCGGLDIWKNGGREVSKKRYIKQKSKVTGGEVDQGEGGWMEWKVVWVIEG